MKKIIFYLFIFLPFLSAAQKTKRLTVYFKFNEHTLDFTSKNKIDSSAKIQLIQEVQIEAHCDSVGSNEFNDTLSLKRALEVKQYFISKNLDKASIHIKAFGKRVPLNNNETEEARALNRRAEILIVTKDSIPDFKPDRLPQDTGTLNIKSLEVGESLKLENIYFEGGRHELLPMATKTLRLLLNTLKTSPTLEIEIQGHICCGEGNTDGYDFDARTWNLSVNRAKAIYDYLVKKGINPSRLSYKGFGASHKLVEEKSEYDRSLNRRVEIKIMKK